MSPQPPVRPVAPEATDPDATRRPRIRVRGPIAAPAGRGCPRGCGIGSCPGKAFGCADDSGAAVASSRSWP